MTNKNRTSLAALYYLSFKRKSLSQYSILHLHEFNELCFYSSRWRLLQSCATVSPSSAVDFHCWVICLIYEQNFPQEATAVTTIAMFTSLLSFPINRKVRYCRGAVFNQRHSTELRPVSSSSLRGVHRHGT